MEQVPKVIPAVSLGLRLGVTTLIDDITTMRRLRYHPDPRLRLLLTPEGKLRGAPAHRPRRYWTLNTRLSLSLSLSLYVYFEC